MECIKYERRKLNEYPLLQSKGNKTAGLLWIYGQIERNFVRRETKRMYFSKHVQNRYTKTKKQVTGAHI